MRARAVDERASFQIVSPFGSSTPTKRIIVTTPASLPVLASGAHICQPVQRRIAKTQREKMSRP